MKKIALLTAAVTLAVMMTGCFGGKQSLCGKTCVESNPNPACGNYIPPCAVRPTLKLYQE